MDYLWTPWRYQYLTAPKKPEACVFCTMAAGNDDAAALIVFRGVHNFVVLNRFPYTTGHLMVVPFQHTSDLAAITEAAANEMMALAREAERHLKWLYRPQGINLGMNLGECAGAGVAHHIHMHVLPRWIGDASFMSVVSETRVLGEELPVSQRRLAEAFQRKTPPS